MADPVVYQEPLEQKSTQQSQPPGPPPGSPPPPPPGAPPVLIVGQNQSALQPLPGLPPGTGDRCPQCNSLSLTSDIPKKIVIMLLVSKIFIFGLCFLCCKNKFPRKRCTACPYEEPKSYTWFYVAFAFVIFGGLVLLAFFILWICDRIRIINENS